MLYLHLIAVKFVEKYLKLVCSSHLSLVVDHGNELKSACFEDLLP